MSKVMLRKPKSWIPGYISHSEKGNIRVRYLPGTRKRIAISKDGDIFVYETNRKVWHSIKHGIYTLMRRDHHIADWYTAEELPTLAHISDHLAELDSEFVGLLSSNAEDEKEDIQTRLGLLLSRMGRVLNDSKRQARHQIVYILPLRDSQGRVNQGVFRCRTNTAIRRIETRLEEISGIKPWILFYEGKVAALATFMEERNARLLTLLRKTYLALGGKHGSQQKQDLHQARVLLTTVGKTCEDLVVKPYVRTGQRVCVESINAILCIEAKDVEGARAMVHTMGHSLRLKEIRRALEITIVPLFDEFTGDEDKRTLWAQSLTSALQENAIEPLSRIDETGFLLPVRDDATLWISETISRLQEPTTITQEEVLTLKEKIKHTAGIL